MSRVEWAMLVVALLLFGLWCAITWDDPSREWTIDNWR